MPEPGHLRSSHSRARSAYVLIDPTRLSTRRSPDDLPRVASVVLPEAASIRALNYEAEFRRRGVGICIVDENGLVEVAGTSY